MSNHLIWFGNNLRVNDNQLLDLACQGDRVIAVYFFDPRHFEFDAFGFKKMERFRAKFLLETVQQLKQSLDTLNITLLTYFDRPEHKIPALVNKHQIDALFFQKEWTSEEMDIIKSVKAKLPSHLKVVEHYDQFLFHPDDIPYKTFEAIPDVFTQFRKLCEQKANVRPSTRIPKKMPDNNRIDNKTIIPTLEKLGLELVVNDQRSAFTFKGGESSALQRVQHYFWNSKKLAFYKRTRNGLVGTDYSSKLSAWLANGSLSARTIYWEVKRFEEEVEQNQDTYWLIFELIWRDYFKYVSLKYGNQIFKIEGIMNRTYEWYREQHVLLNWINGQTEDDFVNANMLELKHTGWMSNRGRQNVASYWAKHLQQDWRIGAAYFESMLIDYDVHSNWGNWMYNSGVGNDPRNRTFNTKRQAEMYDPNRKFQQLWLQPTLF